MSDGGGAADDGLRGRRDDDDGRRGAVVVVAGLGRMARRPRRLGGVRNGRGVVVGWLRGREGLGGLDSLDGRAELRRRQRCVRVRRVDRLGRGVRRRPVGGDGARAV